MESHHIEWHASDAVREVCQFASGEDGTFYEPYYEMSLVCRKYDEARYHLPDGKTRPDPESPFTEIYCSGCCVVVRCRMWEVEPTKDDRSMHRVFFTRTVGSSIQWCPIAHKHVMGPPLYHMSAGENIRMCFGCGCMVNHVPAQLQPLEYNDLVSRLMRPSTPH